MALPNHNAMDFKGMELRCDQVTAATSLSIAGTTVTGTEFAAVDGVTAGTVTASKAVIVDANSNIAGFNNVRTGYTAITTAAGNTILTVASTYQQIFTGVAAQTVTMPDATTLVLGHSFYIHNESTQPVIVKRSDAVNIHILAAGTGAIFVCTSVATAAGTWDVEYLGVVAATGKKVVIDNTLTFAGTDNTTFTFPATSGTVVSASDAKSYLVDAITMSPVKWVDITATAAALDAAGTVPVITGVAGDQYKVREIILVGGGTNFDAGGDRLIDLTDGTTVWTTIANADIEAAPAASLRWGDAKVPLLTGTSNTASVAGQAIRFVYSGGTTDHGGVGSITFSVCLEKVA